LVVRGLLAATFIFVNYVIVPDRVLGNCPDPGTQGTGPGKVNERATVQASQAPVQADTGKGICRDPAAMGETLASVLPTHLRRDKAGSTANIVISTNKSIIFSVITP
jgi:hypothetical protein